MDGCHSLVKPAHRRIGDSQRVQQARIFIRDKSAVLVANLTTSSPSRTAASDEVARIQARLFIAASRSGFSSMALR